jgi:Uma2 family endonuclease
MVIPMTFEPSAPADYLLQDFLALETPKGYHAELISGEIVVTPPPDGRHESIASTVARQVIRSSASDMDLSEVMGLALPATEGSTGNHVIPDMTFSPRQARLFDDAPSWMDPQGVAMVTEVTSSRPEIDREAKRLAYATAGIPLYLLVDRTRRHVTLFSEPSGGDYAHAVTVAFGGKLDLPEPFGFALDTSDFPV